jgi:hypothetical protein
MAFEDDNEKFDWQCDRMLDDFVLCDGCKRKVAMYERGDLHFCYQCGRQICVKCSIKIDQFSRDCVHCRREERRRLEEKRQRLVEMQRRLWKQQFVDK